jgi:alanine transaminase
MAGFTLNSINPAFLNVEHAVRGELAIKAQEYRARLADGASDLPFTKVIFSNAGNPQEKGLDQKPLTFLRQVPSHAVLSRKTAHVKSRLQR